MRYGRLLLARSPYEELGLSPNASLSEVKAKFRKLARQWHPDCHAESHKKFAEQKFRQINSSYQSILAQSPKSRTTATGETQYTHVWGVNSHFGGPSRGRGAFHGEYGLSRWGLAALVSGCLFIGTVLGFWPYYLARKDSEKRAFQGKRNHFVTPDEVDNTIVVSQSIPEPFLKRPGQITRGKPSEGEPAPDGSSTLASSAQPS